MLAGVNCHHGSAAVGVPQEMMAAAGADDLKAGLAQGGEDLLARAIVAAGSCFHQNALHADELRRPRHVALDLQAEVNRFLDPLH